MRFPSTTAAPDPAQTPHPENLARALVPLLWLRLSIAAAALGGVGSIVALSANSRIYGGEVGDLVDQATAQDLVNLVAVAPLTVLLGLGAARGSVRAFTCWVGCVAFTVYSYAIYTFSIHFGPLFLVWIAVLGLSFYALVGALTTMDAALAARWFGGRPTSVTSWTLWVAGTAFSLLWLSEILPDLAAGRASTSGAALNLPTNPVHVLDLALFLPAVLVSGTLLRRRRPLGHASAPGVLVFLALTSVPIEISPLVALAHGRTPAWGAAAPIGIVLAWTAFVLYRTLHQPHPATTPGPASPQPLETTS
jgi:hypothetical protein